MRAMSEFSSTSWSSGRAHDEEVPLERPPPHFRRRIERRFAISAALLMSLVSFTILSPGTAAESLYATPTTTNSGGTPEGLEIKVISDEGSLITLDQLGVVLDRGNRSAKIRLADPGSSSFSILISESSLRRLIPYPSFEGVSFSRRSFESVTWLGARFQAPVDPTTFEIRGFRPEIRRAWFTYGSPASIALERPMFISLAELPQIEWVAVTRSNPNGTWTERMPVPMLRLGINFTDVDTRGQRVALNRSWLGTYGLPNPYFQDADGKPVANTSDSYFFYLSPTHFSIMYVFTTNEAFTKEDYGTYSDVFWDSVNRNIHVKADRRDPVGLDERLRSPAPVVYDQTSSFTVRAMWKITQKGHWQLAVPVFFMGGTNHRVDMANSVYVIYASRDQSPSHQWYNPMFYLRYRDSAGTMKKDYSVVVPFASQYEFLMGYDAYTRTMRWEVYDALGAVLASTTYAVGLSETFSLGTVGAGAWGSGGTSEPVTIASTDNLYFDTNMACNGNFEVDSNADGIPDNWDKWIWTSQAGARSSTRAKFGSYSHKMADTGNTQSYGLQTVRMSASPDKGYVASTWVYVESGLFDLYLEFWNALSGGARLAVASKSSTSTGQWEYLDLTMTAPTGTVAVDLLVYSSVENVGTGYFDGAELRLRRSFWSVNNHDGDTGNDLEGWGVAFDRAADLGVSYVRTDLRWNEFELSSDDNWSATEIGHWRSVIQIGKTRGIDIIAILNGPKPSWVTDANKYTEFGEFCRKMGQEFGASIYYYQILNEHNWNQEVTGDLPTFATNCFNGLLTGEGVTSVNHKSAFKSIVNALVDGQPYWDYDLMGWLSSAGSAINIATIDYYPGTYAPNACNDWDFPLNTLFQILRDYGREGGIMETGFSSYNVPGHYPQDQEDWLNCAFPVIQSKVRTHNDAYPATPFLIAGWYELADHNSWGTWVLDNFGILYDRFWPLYLGEKPATDDFRAWMSNFQW